MTGETEVFPHKMDMNSVVIYYYYLMGQEAAKDGWEKEFEDLVDLLLIALHCIFDEKESKAWEEIDNRGSEEEMALLEGDPLKFGIKKRKRIKEKLKLATMVIDKNKLGFKHIKEYKSDFDPEEIPQEL